MKEPANKPLDYIGNIQAVVGDHQFLHIIKASISDGAACNPADNTNDYYITGGDHAA